MITLGTGQIGLVKATLAELHRDTAKLVRPVIDSQKTLLITDGGDTASDTTLFDLRPALIRSDAFVYAIAIDTPEPQPIAKRVNVQALNEITGQSGGRTEIVRATADLETATASIAEELNSQYVLGYSSSHPGDGQYHSIRLRMTNPTYRVRARNGYVAIRAGSKD